MDYHKVHCPRCGRVMKANELAFDIGGIINIALEKAKNRTFGSTEEWYGLTKLNLCLYLTMDDLVNEYGLKNKSDDTLYGYFEFKVKNLREQLISLANSRNPDFNIDIIAANNNIFEYTNLTKYMAKGIDIRETELASDIQQLAQMIKKNMDDTVIASFSLSVNLEKDDRGNRFANRLLIEFDDHEKKNITRFVCKGEKGRPCGKTLYGQAGKYKEIIIGMAGTARVGKTAYLAALLASILRKGNYKHKLGYDQSLIVNNAFVYEANDAFERDLLEPYVKSEKIAKTPYIFDEESKGKEAVSLFSMTFTIREQNYIFTFIDMPGEVYDDSTGTDGIDVIENNRSIIKEADMIWVCISVEQIEEEAQPGMEQVNTEWRKAITNLGNTMEAISCKGNKPTAVLVTKSDIYDGDKFKLYYERFNPFENRNNPMRYLDEKEVTSPWVNKNGDLFYSNMEWFLRTTFEFMNMAPGLTQSISTIFGSFSPFAVAPYGKNIDNFLEESDPDDSLPKPSMIEGPFLWSLGMLGILKVYKENIIIEEEQKKSFFGLRIQKTKREVLKNIIVEEGDREQLFYYKSSK